MNKKELKAALIKLGYQDPTLKPHLKEVLSHLTNKKAGKLQTDLLDMLRGTVRRYASRPLDKMARNIKNKVGHNFGRISKIREENEVFRWYMDTENPDLQIFISCNTILDATKKVDAVYIDTEWSFEIIDRATDNVYVSGPKMMVSIDEQDKVFARMEKEIVAALEKFTA